MHRNEEDDEAYAGMPRGNSHRCLRFLWGTYPTFVSPSVA